MLCSIIFVIVPLFPYFSYKLEKALTYDGGAAELEYPESFCQVELAWVPRSNSGDLLILSLLPPLHMICLFLRLDYTTCSKINLGARGQFSFSTNMVDENLVPAFNIQQHNVRSALVHNRFYWEVQISCSKL